MLDAFSYNREYDYIRLEGLYRATGRPAHEWDIYIVKELIDNALDADEQLWYDTPSQVPTIFVRMEYINMPPPQSQQLLVSVSNRALFPVQYIESIFSTQRYTSHKTLIKKLTRGTLGNALKTLLGIPYALHNRVADDWQPNLKPLSISTGSAEYLPRYIIDSTTQSISLSCDIKPCKLVTNTVISVGLDYFVQEIPRILEDLEVLARQYAICNPHAEFQWTVEMNGKKWEKVYLARANWSQKFHLAAPMQWYSLTEFKDLLSALYRQQYCEEKTGTLSLLSICSHFSGFQNGISSQSPTPHVAHVLREVGQDSLTMRDLDSPLAKKVYASIGRYSLPIRPAQLGAIGQEHVFAHLSTYFPINGKIHYLQATEEEVDLSIPFIIEVAAVYLQFGKRQLWTAINFSPTYNDPFLSCWLYSILQSSEPVLGLRGLLDTYNLREDTPFLLFFHLICPNIEYNEFSKTEINHLPFKKTLSRALDELLRELQFGREEEEMQLEQIVFQAVDAIMHTIADGEKFVTEQLLEALRIQLSQDPRATQWLEKPDAFNRLRSYITNYQNRHPEISAYIARQADIMLHLPSHPKHYFSIPINQLSQDLLDRYFVNKILYVQERELEPVVIANNWLCQMDMALLQVPSPSTLEEALIATITASTCSILVLHNGDDLGYDLMKHIHSFVRLRHINPHRIVDLYPAKGSTFSVLPTKRMTRELEDWLLSRFTAYGIPIKHTPADGQIRRDIRARFDQRLHEHMLRSIEQHISLARFMLEIDQSFFCAQLMENAQLDVQLKRLQQQSMALESYTTVVDVIVEDFFAWFMTNHGHQLHRMEQFWIKQKKGW